MGQQIIGERGYTYEVKTKLIVWECPMQGCGIVYGIPQEFADSLSASGGAYYCPNGHRLSWSETDADRERKRADRAEQQARAARDSEEFHRQRAAAERRSAAAFKGQVTKMKNRIANGVCPVAGCKRSGFSNVMRHIASWHPAWHADHAHDLGNEKEETSGSDPVSS